MASAQALAVAVSWPRLAIVALGFAVLSLTAPAVADDQVYIWRDATGAVRFSTVQEGERKNLPASDAPITYQYQRETRPGVAISSATDRGPY